MAKLYINSKLNNTVKYIKSLHIKKYRKLNQKYILEGIKMVEEMINSEKLHPEFILYCEEMLNSNELGKNILKTVEDLEFKGKYQIISTCRDVFETLCDTKSPQGIIAVMPCKEKNINDLQDKLSSIITQDKFVILEGIKDPGNLGSIIRSALSFEVRNIICIGCADCFDLKVVRATMGTILRANIYNLSLNNTEKNEEQIYAKLKEITSKAKYKIIGTSLLAKKYLNEYIYSSKVIYVLGNEANGITQQMFNICDDTIKIRMSDKAESLNVSVAAGILLNDMYQREGV